MTRSFEASKGILAAGGNWRDKGGAVAIRGSVVLSWFGAPSWLRDRAFSFRREKGPELEIRHAADIAWRELAFMKLRRILLSCPPDLWPALFTNKRLFLGVWRMF